MCEFTILLEGEEVFQDVVRVKVDSDRVFLSDVIDETLEIPYSCWVESVDVATQRITMRVNGAADTAMATVAVR